MKRPTSNSRKLIKNQGQFKITLPKGKIEDLDWEAGDWIDVNLVPTGRNAGTLRLEEVEQKEDD